MLDAIIRALSMSSGDASLTLDQQCSRPCEFVIRSRTRRVPKDQAPENLAVLRHSAVHLLIQQKTARGGIHAKQRQAAGKEYYLRNVLAAGN